jgi:hypothetical protein
MVLLNFDKFYENQKKMLRGCAPWKKSEKNVGKNKGQTKDNEVAGQ